MNIERIQEEIQNAERDKARAEGTLEQIRKTWKDDYDCNSREDVERLLNDLTEQHSTLTTKYEKLEKEIRGALDEL